MRKRGNKLIALSFDDGPGMHTRAILELLEKHDARATFFLLGRVIRKNAELVERAARLGHEVANHTFNHPRLSAVTPGEIRKELQPTSALIEEITGQTPKLFRPPYGLDGLIVEKIAKQMGMKTVRWNVNPKDRDGADAETICRRVLAHSRSGSVAVLHDGGDRDVTREAVRILLPELSEQGYTFVTVSEILERSRRARRQVIVRRRGPLRRAGGQARMRFRATWPAVSRA